MPNLAPETTPAKDRRPEAYYSSASMWLAKTFWRPVLLGVYFYGADGLEHIPATGPVILAPSHKSYFDPVFVSFPVKREVYYLAWDALLKIPFFAGGLRRLGAIPVRLTPAPDRKAYEAGIRILRGGNVLCVFPEGMRGWDEGLNPLQAGVARLALATGATIVPMWINGALKSWPRWKLLPRGFSKVTLRCGPGIDPGPFAAKGREGAEALTRRLEERMLDLQQSFGTEASGLGTHAPG